MATEIFSAAFAPAAKARSCLVLPEPVLQGRPGPIPRAEFLRRTFQTEVLTYPRGRARGSLGGHCRPITSAIPVDEVLEVLDPKADGIGDAQVGQGASRTKPVHRPEPLGRLANGHEPPGFSQPHDALTPDP